MRKTIFLEKSSRKKKNNHRKNLVLKQLPSKKLLQIKFSSEIKNLQKLDPLKEIDLTKKKVPLEKFAC